ncbi:hypothetical protein JKA74_08810 [Marivirga sp. S37H4]|uniref:Uncharacterized protein n=1 Tax=Marivirga aurantiaca TaxID=2802615 RepID=A0A935C7P2_9BACT|nr:hypothetical protein [Marivirga aurantiaca]MBK6265136.1 hypothetical protein [Marivirga aurantiaca]
MKYEELFAVSYHHEYYKSTRFRGFGMLASHSTERILKSYGVIIKESETGFTALFKEEKVGQSLLRNLKQRLQFRFFIVSRDRMWMNYSDIPGDLNDYGYWLTNMNDNPNDPTLLHKEEFLGQSDRVQFISSLADIQSQIADDTSVLIENMFGTVLFEGQSSELNEGIGEDYSDEPGYLKATAGGEVYEYYYKPRGIKQIIGMIDIVINPSGDENHNFNAILNSQYKVNINSRATTWRYNLINRDNYKYSDFKIYSGKDIVPTTAVEEKMMVNGDKAYYIETTAPIQLKERYSSYLELEMIKVESDRNVRKRINLPVPDINKVRMAKDADVYRAYSEMYIYF